MTAAPLALFDTFLLWFMSEIAFKVLYAGILNDIYL